MSPETYDILDCSVNINIPSTLDEAIEIVGAEKVLDGYVGQLVYHSIAGKIRGLTVKALETNFPDHKRTRDAENAVDETDAKYISRLLKEGVITAEDLAGYVQDAADNDAAAFATCAKAERRTGAGSAPSKDAVNFVAKQLAAGKRDQLAASLTKKLGHPVDGNDELALARGVQAIQLAAWRAAKKAAESERAALIA